MHRCCMTWHCHIFWAFSLKGEADEVVGEDMHQGSQVGGLCFGKSSLFLKKLGEGSSWLCARSLMGKSELETHHGTGSLFW